MILHLYNSGHRDSDAEIQCICSIKSACTPTFEKNTLMKLSTIVHHNQNEKTRGDNLKCKI